MYCSCDKDHLIKSKEQVKMKDCLHSYIQNCLPLSFSQPNPCAPGPKCPDFSPQRCYKVRIKDRFLLYPFNGIRCNCLLLQITIAFFFSFHLQFEQEENMKVERNQLFEAAQIKMEPLHSNCIY